MEELEIVMRQLRQGDAKMNLEKICALTKKAAEAEDTKQKSRTKVSYFTRARKMSFSALVYYILHPDKESTNLEIKRFFAMIGKEGCRSLAIQNIIDEISLAVSPVHPNRSFRRNPWPRKAKFCFNRRSNI